MQEYDPENGTFQNAEVDPETKEVHYGELNPDEDEILYERPKRFPHHPHLYKHWWFWCLVAVVLAALLTIVYQLNSISNEVEDLQQQVTSQDSVPLTPINQEEATIPYVDDTTIYTIQLDTIFVDSLNVKHRLRIYKVLNGIPELYVGRDSLDDIDTNDMNIVFAARAADYEPEHEAITDFFIYKGECLGSISRHREGFCAIIDSTITLGVETTTPLLETVLSKKGYFFRQIPLISGENQVCFHKNKKTFKRRALCFWHGEIVYIEGFDKMTLTNFAQLLSEFGVTKAINMVGSDGGYGIWRDKEGKLYHWGTHEITNHTNVSYLIWKKK